MVECCRGFWVTAFVLLLCGGVLWVPSFGVLSFSFCGLGSCLWGLFFDWGLDLSLWSFFVRCGCFAEFFVGFWVVLWRFRLPFGLWFSFFLSWCRAPYGGRCAFPRVGLLVWAVVFRPFWWCWSLVCCGPPAWFGCVFCLVRSGAALSQASPVAAFHFRPAGVDISLVKQYRTT